MSKHNFVVVDQSLSVILVFTAQETVVYNAVYCLSIASSIPDISTFKKLFKIAPNFDRFLPSEILRDGAPPQKVLHG